MTLAKRKVLLLALGNDLLGDDGVAFYVARALKEEFNEHVDIIESSEAGLALMEMMEGYEQALLLDAIVTGRYQPGTIVEFSPDDFRKVIAPSPHYAGIPEVLSMAKHLNISIPQDLRILALEVENPYDFCQTLSPSVEQALPGYVEKARDVLRGWRHA